MARRYPPEGTIFDIGGGNGYVSVGLVEAGFDSVVVEPGPEGAAVARARGLQVVRAPFEDLALPQESLPSAALFDVLEHIDDADSALAGLWRALKRGGTLYIAVPSYNFLWSSQDVYGGHFRRYTTFGLKDDLRRAGFSILFGTYFFACLVPGVFALRTVPSLLGRRGDDAAHNAPEHSLPDGVIARLINRSLDWETRTIAKGGSIPFGTSCLVVARKD